ncbi:SGNH/GDSL hydrolase family protein [Legionella sp. D16C41]|uniref:SGNH/GDSL hydrolase family protein n=1 Tax=Legionella sp. D16C41 TaxID=3402688 RepID=UPI003AF949EF
MKLVYLKTCSLFDKLKLVLSLTIINLLLNINLHAATSCQLVVDGPVKMKTKLGILDLKAVNATSISPKLTQNIFTNLDDLYGLTKNNKTWFFRINSLISALPNDNIYLVTWANNDIPPIGTYEIAAYDATRKPKFKHTLDTIGDSITWVGNGKYLRCLLRDQGLAYDFKGSHIDPFGFGHDAEGGDTTENVLARINKIPTTDAYFLLIGTNDRVAPEMTVNNILQIAKQLSAKNKQAKIYISTLLPRNDDYTDHSQAVNKLLLQTKNICPNCVLVDVGGDFYALKNWQQYLPDNLHPSFEGYVALSKLINNAITKADKGLVTKH